MILTSAAHVIKRESQYKVVVVVVVVVVVLDIKLKNVSTNQASL